MNFADFHSARYNYRYPSAHVERLTNEPFVFDSLVFIDQLVEGAGFAIEWSSMSQEAMGRACREARNGEDPQMSVLKRLISLNTISI